MQIRNDRIDKYVGKLHDEELQQQELDLRLRQTAEALMRRQLTNDDDPDGKLTRQLQKQAKLLAQRAHMLSGKANECSAGNSRLRAQIDQQRAHKLRHLRHHKALRTREDVLVGHAGLEHRPNRPATLHCCSTLLLYTAALHCCATLLRYTAALHCCATLLLTRPGLALDLTRPGLCLG